MSPPPIRIHFGASFTDRPADRRLIRTALERAAYRHPEAEPDVPTWIVIQDEIAGTSSYVAHHTRSQFTLTAPSVDALCQRVDTELRSDTRYDEPTVRLDRPPDERPDHKPSGRS